MATKEIALITGATSGIGYDFAVILAKKGYDLFLVSRKQAALEDIKTAFEPEYGVTVEIMAIDLSTTGSAKKVFDHAVQRGLEVTVLINNAGVGVCGAHVDLPLEAVSSMLHLNMIALTELCMLFGKAMQARKKGHILNVASTAAYQPVPYLAAYGGTKSYVLHFSEALAKEMEDHHVVVTCLSPGPTQTRFLDNSGIGERQKGVWASQSLMPSEIVAQIGIDAMFAGKLSVVAGRMNTCMTFSNRFAPRRLVAAISKKVIKSSLDM
jgi:uncharacterized protein